MALTVEQAPRSRGVTPLDVTLWLLLLLFLVPPAVALQGNAWGISLVAWAVPAALLAGVVAGGVLVLVSVPQRWWWLLVCTIPLLGAAVAAGGVIAVRNGPGGQFVLGTALLGGYASALAAAGPWLVLRARQTWLAVLITWVTVAGAWRTDLTMQQLWWVLFLLFMSLVVIGIAHLRDETTTWRRFGLERIGSVLWPSAQAIVSLSLLVALTGLVPLGAVRLLALSQTLQRTPLGQAGPLTYESANGTPVAILGSRLSLDAPDTTNNTVILSYAVVKGPPVAPPLIGATLDTFDGASWTQGPVTASVPLAAPLPAPVGATTMQATVTINTLPRMGAAPLLLGFSEPLSFSVPSKVSLLNAGDPSAVSVTNWEATSALAAGTRYSTVSAILPDDPQPIGSLDPDVQLRMTAVPDALQPMLHATATKWIGTRKTPLAQARALLDAMQANLVLDARATPPTNVDAVAWLLEQKHGNALLWTTTYILLGRSIGLPLRLVEGYLPGAYDNHLQQTVVRARDAAAWAQLAIPGNGWLDLFPASNVLKISEPRIVYSGTPVPTPTSTPRTQPTATSAQQRSPVPAMPDLGRGNVSPAAAALLGSVVLVVLLLLAAGLLALRWARFGRNLGPVMQVFARVAVLAKLAGIRLRSSDTASQATSKVVAYLPEHAETLHTLNRSYERMRYGPPAEVGSLAIMREQWQRLRGAFIRLVVTRPWRRGLGTSPTRVSQSGSTARPGIKKG